MARVGGVARAPATPPPAIYSAGINDARSDAALVSATQAGDRAALDVLLRRHHDRLYGLCRRLTGNDTDAADACQDALIAIVRGLARFDGRSQFSTWAHRVATNACLDELRRRRRRPEPGLYEDSGPEAPATGAEAPAASPSGTGSVAERIDLDSALRSLSHDFRVAVVLRDQCGLAYEEIAEVVGVPVGTVRSRISRGRALLAGWLGASYVESEAGAATSDGRRREPGPTPPTSKGEYEPLPAMTSNPSTTETTEDQP